MLSSFSPSRRLTTTGSGALDPATRRTTAASITLRSADPTDPADAFALWELAQLDSAPEVPSGPLILATSDGKLLAALSLRDGAVIADPFERTAEIVALMRRHADLLGSAARPRRARRRAGAGGDVEAGMCLAPAYTALTCPEP